MPEDRLPVPEQKSEETSTPTESVANPTTSELRDRAALTRMLVDTPATEAFRRMQELAFDSPVLQSVRRMQEFSLDNSVIQSIRRMQESALDNPFLRLTKQMQDDAKRWQKLIADIEPSPLIKAAQDIARKSDSWGRLATAALQSDAPWMRVQDSLKQSSRIFEDLFKQAKEFESPLLRKFEEIARSTIATQFSRPDGDLLSALRAITEEARPQLEAMSGAGTITASPAELAGVGSVTSKSVEKAPLTGAEKSAVAEWDTWLERLPPVMRFFVEFLYHLSIVLLSDVAYHKFLAEKEPTSQVAIATEMRNDLGKEWVEDLRCVRGKSLRVRETPGKDGRVVGSLTEHQGIEVVETQGPWSRIRYFDHASGALTEGWAASAYLARFKC